jgi:cell division control protein 6
VELVGDVAVARWFVPGFDAIYFRQTTVVGVFRCFDAWRFAVALDEFDQLEGKTEIVYDLQMLNSEAENKLGVVMVSNQHPSRLQLDPRSRSRLNCQTLEFQSYNVQQLVEILGDRVEQAFRPGTVSDDVLEVIAEQVAEQGGDCREALNLLLRAGRYANQQGTGEVTVDVVEAVVDSG